MPLVEGGACRQGEPGEPPQFIDAIANKDVVQMHALRRLTALQLLLYATPKPPILFCARSSRPNRFKYQIKMIYACL